MIAPLKSPSIDCELPMAINTWGRGCEVVVVVPASVGTLAQGDRTRAMLVSSATRGRRRRVFMACTI
ncbi:hypothetical protein GALL_452220 [mine drainage metagenome]|uniref:Uncharacterized protein n=1 Tax=mine drainage metagenome TaxID=410659 RepID=A0A1J5QAZ0_9ZZZZ